MRNIEKREIIDEAGVAGEHIQTFKSELGYLKLESLQTLGNGGF